MKYEQRVCVRLSFSALGIEPKRSHQTSIEVNCIAKIALWQPACCHQGSLRTCSVPLSRRSQRESAWSHSLHPVMLHSGKGRQRKISSLVLHLFLMGLQGAANQLAWAIRFCVQSREGFLCTALSFSTGSSDRPFIISAMCQAGTLPPKSMR